MNLRVEAMREWESYHRREAWNIKLRVIAMRVRELLEKGSKKHESAGNNNESGRGIREGKQET